MPTGLVNDIDLIQLSAITFNEFNGACPIIDPKEQSGKLFQRFSSCIEKIKHEFQYPQYYNGLMGLLLLFKHDESYNLNDFYSIMMTFDECKELVVTGYEDFEDFGIDSINKLICILSEMSSIFRNLHDNSVFAHQFPQPLGTVCEDNNADKYFEHKNGVKTQIKPIDLSHTHLKEHPEYGAINLRQLVPMTSKADSENRIEYTFQNFQKAYGSVICGACLTIRIGKLTPLT